MRKSGRRKSGRSRRTRRKRGGGCALVGADLQYDLAGSSAAKQSLGQGGDFLQYHEGQHGGAYGPFGGTPIASSYNLDVPHGAAGLNGLDRAFAGIAGLQDGGRRRRRTRRGLKHRRRHRTRIMGGKRKHRTKHRRSKGGALGYSPYPASGMLGVKAELHPDFQSGIELDSAMMRQAQ